MEDTIKFENISFNGVFGAIWEASGSFNSSPDVDGILGMSYNSDLSVLYLLSFFQIPQSLCLLFH